MKKVFVSIKGNEESNPIQMALERVASVSNLVIDDPDAADLIIVNSSSEALKMLKENDEAIVVVAIMPGNEHNETGARSLKNAYPGRVIVGQVFRVKEGTDDVMLVPYIITFNQEKEEK